MGMPVTIDISGIDRPHQTQTDELEKVFAYFEYIDEKYSPFKATSEVSVINSGRASENLEMQEILQLCEATKKETGGYFDPGAKTSLILQDWLRAGPLKTPRT